MRALCIFLLLVAFTASAQFEKANWISTGFRDDTIHTCPIFKKTFSIDKALRCATALITAHGIYEAKINNRRVGHDYFTPGWTSYGKRLQYQRYDVSAQLKKGNNEISVTIGEGWWRGPFGGGMDINNYGSDASVLVQLDLVYTDGSKQQIVSDTSWRSSTGPILHSDIYGGEMYDARISPLKWNAVNIENFSKNNLIPQEGETVQKQEIFKPKKILITPKGEQVIDFGQDMAGWVQFKVRGKAGDTIRLYHGEVLDKEGNFYTGNLRDAKATDIYILKGNGIETFEPHFTYHGFRYVKVEGCRANVENFTTIALHTALKHTGSFSCSNPLINQLQSNIEWSLNSNFFDIPTDCPQRSERLGWTGDAQVFCRTASFNRDVNLFFTRWLHDMRTEQGSNGVVASIVPNIYDPFNEHPKRATAGWGDAATIIPWTMYWVYGDTALLREQYPCMKAWVDYITSASENFLWKAGGYGDWLAPGDSTSLPLIDQCFWAYSTRLAVNAATVLEKEDDVQRYSLLLSKIKNAFLKNYIDAGGTTITNTQTSYVLALQFDLLPDSLQVKAARNLVDLIKANNNHLATGFLGTPYLLPVLTRYGYTDLAYALLNQETYPSWLYPVKKGATTIWERWDAVRPDGSVQPTSYNHYAYGAVGDWLYRAVAGIDALEPGYKKIKIEPHIGGGLTWVNASYQCNYGKIVSNWKVQGRKVFMHVEIPKGASALIFVPGKQGITVKQGSYRFEGLLVTDN